MNTSNADENINGTCLPQTHRTRQTYAAQKASEHVKHCGLMTPIIRNSPYRTCIAARAAQGRMARRYQPTVTLLDCVMNSLRMSYPGRTQAPADLRRRMRACYAGTTHPFKVLLSQAQHTSVRSAAFGVVNSMLNKCSQCRHQRFIPQATSPAVLKTTAPRGKSDTYPTSHAVAAAEPHSVSRKVSPGWAPMSRSVCGPQRSTEVLFRLLQPTEVARAR